MFLGRRLLLMILRLFYLQIVKTFIYTTVSRKHLLLKTKRIYDGSSAGIPVGLVRQAGTSKSEAKS